MSLAANHKRVQICNSHRPKIAKAGCCNDRGAEKLLAHFQQYIKEHQLEDQITIVESACLRNCTEGISIRVLPDMTLYGEVKIQDIEEIVQQHLLNNQIVERLTVRPKSILDRF
ncbi:MAG: (2Fe-2S) ferredoxin domain-containing protein [Bacteroidota bacterium]